jgi:TRADD-N domain-containing protein
MAAGFALVLYGVYRAFSSAPLEVAVLTAAAGTITQTIGATFLLIYRSTMTQAKEYVGTLERINSVGMALQIVDLMKDGELKDQARLKLVTDILHVSRK